MGSEQGLVLTTVHPDRARAVVVAELGDAVRLHHRILGATDLLPAGPRVLWAQWPNGSITIRAAGAVPAAAFPAGWVEAVVHQPWPAPTAGPVTAAVVVNPTRVPNQRQQRNARVALTDPADITDWLTSRLSPAMEVKAVDVTRAATVRGRHRTGLVLHWQVAARVYGVVVDPVVLHAQAVAGIGRGRAHGAGLSLWWPV